MTDNREVEHHPIRSTAIGVLLILLSAVGLVHAQQPGTGEFARQCVTPAYADAHHAFSDRFGCFFVRSSLGEFSMPNIGMPSGGVLLAFFVLLIMVIVAGLATRRQYGSE